MKNIKILLVIYFIGSANMGFGQKYQYPVKPGTREWSKLLSTEEMINVCQLPESTLKSISTNDLLVSCLEYPLLLQYTASNSPYEGVISITNIFNGFNELLNRSDYPVVLVDYYKKANVTETNDNPNMGAFAFNFLALELLIGDERVINKLDVYTQKQVIDIILDKYGQKKELDEYFGFYGKMTTTFILNRYVEKVYDNSFAKSDQQKLFTEKMIITDLDVVDYVLSMNLNFLNAK